MPTQPILLQAKFVATMDIPGVIRDGGVLVDGGKIVAVDVASSLRKSQPTAQVVDYPKRVLIPGLVNAHVHLELSDCVAGAPPIRGFADWLVRMLQRTRIEPDAMDAKVKDAVRIGIAQCQKFGVTTVGDISRQCGVTRPLLREAKLRVVSYGEVMAMAQRRGLLEERLATAADTQFAGENLKIGVTPHSPYSVERPAYVRCIEFARQRNLPLATHLAESADERTFLANHTGPLRDLWDAWLTWDDKVPTFQGGPIALAKEVGLLDYPKALLAHVNYCDDAEMDLLANGKASVVYCPRTHAYFGHPPHRWREMLARGINVAIGTDSCASSPDLNLLDDLRLVRKIAPEIDAQSIWKLATTSAARAISMADQVGSLSEGKSADLIAFDVSSDDPLEEILREQQTPSAVWFNGSLETPT